MLIMSPDPSWVEPKNWNMAPSQKGSPWTEAIGKRYLEAEAGQTWCGASWSWDLQASGTGMWQSPLLSLPASSGSRMPLPTAPSVGAGSSA